MVSASPVGGTIRVLPWSEGVFDHPNVDRNPGTRNHLMLQSRLILALHVLRFQGRPLNAWRSADNMINMDDFLTACTVRVAVRLTGTSDIDT